MGLISFLIIGLLAGFIARAILPGRQGMGLLATLLLGVTGSFLGGFLGAFFRSNGNWMVIQPSGLIWSTVGAMIVLAIAVLARGRRHA